MSQKVGRVSPGKWIALIVAAFCMLATGFVPPPEGLSQSGFQVLGIIIGASILFLSWGTGWPSMATIFAFPLNQLDWTVAGHFLQLLHDLFHQVDLLSNYSVYFRRVRTSSSTLVKGITHSK